MKVTIAKKADTDGWKAVKSGSRKLGHIIKVGETWRARGLDKAEHLGLATQMKAAEKLGKVAEDADAEVARLAAKRAPKD